jgi:hypothetical protein
MDGFDFVEQLAATQAFVAVPEIVACLYNIPTRSRSSLQGGGQFRNRRCAIHFRWRWSIGLA